MNKRIMKKKINQWKSLSNSWCNLYAKKSKDYSIALERLEESTKQTKAFVKKSVQLEAELKTKEQIIGDYVHEVKLQEKEIANLKKSIGELKQQLEELKEEARFDESLIQSYARSRDYWLNEYEKEKAKPWYKKLFKKF